MPQISVIVPVYNAESTLRQCVDSLLGQTMKDMEIILVDDGSPDRCGEMCDDYASRHDNISVVHKRNGGLSSARNAGIKIANGDYLGFVDSDDWVTADMYSCLYSLAVQHHADIVSVSYVTTSNRNGTVRQESFDTFVYDRNEALVQYMELGLSSRISDYPAWNKLYRRNLFELVQFPENQTCEDVATNFELIQHCSTYVRCGKVCYFYYQNTAGLSRSKFGKNDFDILITADKLVALAQTEADDRLLRFARVKKARTYFSLLAKLAYYGCEEGVIDEASVVKEYLNELRHSYWLLVSSSIPLNRKLAITALCISYCMFRLLCRVKVFIGRWVR